MDNHYAVVLDWLNCPQVIGGCGLWVYQPYNIIACHSYAVIGYYYDATASDYRYVVKNPWGYYESAYDVLEADIASVFIVNTSGSTPAGSLPASASPFAASAVAATAPVPSYVAAVSRTSSNTFVDAVAMPKTVAADITAPPGYWPGFAETRLLGSALTGFQAQTPNYSVIDPAALHRIIENEFDDLYLKNQADEASSGVSELLHDESPVRVGISEQHANSPATNKRTAHYAALLTIMEKDDVDADSDIARLAGTGTNIKDLSSAVDAVLDEETLLID